MVSEPNLSPNGKQVAFSWRGDIWVAATSGGAARRLTTDIGDDSQPHFSPDGSEIAFISNRTGSDQIYRMPSGGGIPVQVTYHSEGYSLHDWFPDGQSLLASGSRDHYWRGAERLLKVRLDRRSADIMLADATATDAALDREGKRILFVREGERWWRKGYRGERASQIWMLDIESGKFTEVLHEGVDCRWPLWNRNGKAFFFTKGDLSGFGLWRGRLDAESGQAIQQTQIADFEDDSIVFPTIARNSGTIVFRHLFDLYRFQPGKDETPVKIDLHYEGDPLVNPDELRRTVDSADDVAFTKDGLEMVFTAGGDLWAMDTELKEPIRMTESGSFESSPIFGPDEKSVYVIAKREGQVDIWKVERTSDEGYWWQPSDLVWTQVTNDDQVESDLRLSPDGESLYFVRGLGELVRWSLDKDVEPIVLTKGFASPEYDLSPCGAWVAYAQSDDDFNNDIWIRATDGAGEPINISQHPDDEGSPRFSPDGKILAFTGRRIDTESDIFYVYLQAEEAERTSRERRLKEALEKMKKNRKDEEKGKEKEDQPEKKSEAAKEGDDAAKEDKETTDEVAEDEKKEDEKKEITKIDFEDITERIQQVSISNTSESTLFWSPEGDKLAFYAAIEGEEGVYTVTFPDELEPKKLTSQRLRQPRWSKDAKGILCLAEGKPALVEASGNVTRYNFSAPQALSQSERLRDAFEEAWAIMRDRWYDPRHAGRNWADVRRKYVDMAAAAGDESTLGQIVELMLGELNGSHNGFTPRRERGEPRLEWTDQTAHLGVRFDDKHQGPGLLVRDVVPGSPADRVETKLAAGDILHSIDGVEVDPSMDLTEILNGRLDRDIELVIHRPGADGGEKTELRYSIRPISYGAARGLLYDAWLEHNRGMVEKLSDGKLGYLHIRGMNMPSFYEFERQLYRVGYGRDGLVIDVRDNGGGSTTDLLLTALTQPRHAITVPRDGGPGYPQSRMVYAVWQKPIIVLCNQNSYSNAEIFSHAIKNLGRGKLVGVQTAGGVISTGAVQITDVGMMRMPFRGWFLPNTGEDMEMNGAMPDHVIWPQPGELPQGIDRQLEKAVEVLSQEITDNPPSMPALKYAHEPQPEEP